MACFSKLLLPSWDWNIAFTFGESRNFYGNFLCFFLFFVTTDLVFSIGLGSILSATDPVAVVALLKSAGASPKLTILIVGESLLNDGTAMVCMYVYVCVCMYSTESYSLSVLFFCLKYIEYLRIYLRMYSIYCATTSKFIY